MTTPWRPGGVGRFVPLHLNLLELFLLLLCVFSGVLNGLRLHAGTAPADGGPIWLLAGWYALLVLGGTGGLVGAFWRDPLTAALITRAAMWPLAGGAAAFAFVITSRGNALSGGLITVFAIFCAGHAIQVKRRAQAAAQQVALLRREVDR